MQEEYGSKVEMKDKGKKQPVLEAAKEPIT
jgi:hypothetical protein